VTSAAEVAASLLAKKIQSGRLPDPFTTREVYRNGWTGLTDSTEVYNAISILEDAGWLRREEVRKSEGGRRTVHFHINPKVTRPNP